jgi:hypothetical protein
LRQQAKSTASLINRILARLGPWYEIRFLRIDTDNNKVLVDIGSHRVIAQQVSGDDRIWFCRSSPITPESTVQFLSCLNDIFMGKVRNDAGELVSA